MKIIAISFEGRQPNDVDIQRMIDVVNKFCYAGTKSTIQVYNEDDLRKMCAKVFVQGSNPTISDAVEQAAIYIEEKYKTVFSDPIKFVLAMAEVKNSLTTESEILKNAISIIVNNQTSTQLKKHGITTKVVSVIKEFSTSYNH